MLQLQRVVKAAIPELDCLEASHFQLGGGAVRGSQLSDVKVDVLELGKCVRFEQLLRRVEKAITVLQLL